MIDTHAHLTDSSFTHDLSNILHRARQAHISRILVVTENPSDYTTAQHICNTNTPLTLCALGLHPCYISTETEETLPSILETFNQTIASNTTSIHAIAEIGLDLTPRVLSLSNEAEKLQLDSFHTALRTAATYRLPMSVHSRGAGRRTLQEILLARRELCLDTVVMHAFDGRAIHAERALAEMPQGLYFSIPPSVIRSDGMRKLVRRLPLDRILLESDAPALPAVQGERNEPCEIIKGLGVIAEERGLEVEKVKSIIEDNERVALTSIVNGDVR